jgi:hypothetical protein
LFNEQRERDVKGVTDGGLGEAFAQGEQQLREDQEYPDLYFDQFRLATPEMAEVQVVFK